MLRAYPQVERSWPYVYSLHVRSLSDIPPDLALASPLFACLLVCDATQLSDADIEDAANILLDRGLASFCAWGADCGRVEGLFDLTIVRRELAGGSDPFILTTSHAKESLVEALWFLFNCGIHHPDRWADCQSTLVITVGSSEWAATVQSRLSNIQELDTDN